MSKNANKTGNMETAQNLHPSAKVLSDSVKDVNNMARHDLSRGQPNPEKQSSASNSSVSSRKLPQIVLNAIRGKVAADNRKNSASTHEVSEDKEPAQGMFQCLICFEEHPQESAVSICDSSHFFCDSCLQHYAIYTVGMQRELECPLEDCDKKLTLNSKFYKALPHETQKRYKKIQLFYRVSKDPTTRLCPNGECEDGILKLETGINPKCPSCNQVFCINCFFPQHNGKCDANEVVFFEKNLRFRQCKKCHIVVEKKEGCNHMTCVCCHEFCYLCGDDWVINHRCYVFPEFNLFPCMACLSNKGVFGSALKILFKATICAPAMIVACLAKTIMSLMLAIMFLLTLIVMGMFGNSCAMICQANSVLKSLGLLLIYPLLMFLGLWQQFEKEFVHTMRELLSDYCFDIMRIFNSLFNW